MRRSLFILLGIIAFLPSFAQKESKSVNAGNKFYNKQKYVDAENAYRDALKKNKKSFEANYNLGNALYRQNKYPEALNSYKQALPLTQDKKRVAAALHNVGNSLMTQRQYDQALDA
jgi:tetratricopeptide (TPR) repeat protein